MTGMTDGMVYEQRARPRADRPRGGYWNLAAPPGLDWSWAERRLIDARNYWVVSTRPDGSPYARAVWGVWWPEGSFVFDSMSLDRNLARDPRVEVHLDDADECVIVGGVAERLTDPDELRRFLDEHNPKYDDDAWSMERPPRWPWKVRAQVAFGIRQVAFSESATRWRFDT